MVEKNVILVPTPFNEPRFTGPCPYCGTEVWTMFADQLNEAVPEFETKCDGCGKVIILRAAPTGKPANSIWDRATMVKPKKKEVEEIPLEGPIEDEEGGAQ